MSVQTFPSPAPQYFEIHFDGEYFLLLDLLPQGGTHPPQYISGRYPTLANAEAGVREYAHDRGLPGF